MRRLHAPLVFGLLYLTVVFGMTACSDDSAEQAREVANGQQTPGTASASDRPNILFIMTDDQTVEDMEYMPLTSELLAEEGTTFENAFVTNSVCCPSRATILRGQYTHNHEIKGAKPPAGGWEKFRDTGLGESTVATWLDAEGYETALVGKYLNGYLSTTYVPPGWDEWYGFNAGAYYDFKLNENGENVLYEGRRNYQTDVLRDKAVEFVEGAAEEENPFFLHLSPWAPHGPVDPAPRHENLFEDEKFPRPPSFNEEDVSDKPEWVRDKPLLTQDEIDEMDEWYRNRLRTLQAVDEMVRDVVETLEETGQLDNTYIFFTTDNGWHMGQHRLPKSKWTAYEEDIKVPLLVRGPGVPAGRTLEQLVINNDFAPTFAELGGASTPDFVDGRSLTPLLGPDLPPKDEWRQSFLVEAKRNGVEDRPPYDAVRTARWSLVRYRGVRDTELYDLQEDPFQLQSLHRTADRALIRELVMQLRDLRRCAGEECRAAENQEIAP